MKLGKKKGTISFLCVYLIRICMFTFHTDHIEVYPGRLKELCFYIRKDRNEKQHVLKDKDDRLGAFSMLYQKPNCKAHCG